MVPPPVLALLLLFPTTDASVAASKAGEHRGWHLQSMHQLLAADLNLMVVPYSCRQTLSN